MNRFMPYVGIASLIVLTLFGGWTHGRLTNRWGMPADMEEGQARLEKLKERLAEGFGEKKEWKVIKTVNMTQLVRDTLECGDAYINAAFLNTATQEQIDGFIVLGPPGPISVHTPEVCYNSRGHQPDKRKQVKIFESESQPDTFWGVTLRKDNNVDADIMRVYYAWGNDGQWEAPESPRMAFGGDSKLFKMQLAATLPSDVNLKENDVCKRFLQAFVPVVNETLFAPAE